MQHLKNSFNYLPDELAHKLHIPNYWAMQLFQYLHLQKEKPVLPQKYQIDDDVFSLPLELQKTLPNDDATKLQLKTVDGHCIETVILTDKNNAITICVSSQIGCPLKCSFCTTGELGFIRNLTSAEIVYQLIEAYRITNQINKIVFMGMGEALLNWKAVQKAINIITEPKGLGIGISKITVSTLGVKINKLIESELRPYLAISLPSVISETCAVITPGRPWATLKALKQDLILFNKKKKRRILIETVLLQGINDSIEEMDALCEYLEGLECFVNLIPYNDASTELYKSPDNSTVMKLQKHIKSKGLICTVRYSRGSQVAGGCGQLGRTAPKL